MLTNTIYRLLFTTQMTRKLYDFLVYIIPRSYISVSNTPTETLYSFDYTNQDGDVTYFDLMCEYSHTDMNGPHARYTLLVDDIPVCVAVRQVLDIPGQPHQKKSSDVMQMERLLRLCSDKIIVQEVISQRNHMLKSINNGTNTLQH